MIMEKKNLIGITLIIILLVLCGILIYLVYINSNQTMQKCYPESNINSIDEELVNNLGNLQFNKFYYYDNEDVTVDNLTYSQKMQIVYNKIKSNYSINGDIINDVYYLNSIPKGEFDYFYYDFLGISENYVNQFTVNIDGYSDPYCLVENQYINCYSNDGAYVYDSIGPDSINYITFDSAEIKDNDLIIYANYINVYIGEANLCGSQLACDNFEMMKDTLGDIYNDLGIYSDPNKNNKLDNLDYYANLYFEESQIINDFDNYVIEKLIEHYKNEGKIGKLEITYKKDSQGIYHWYSSKLIND